MRDLSRSEAVLIAVLTETILYGIYVPIFATCLWIIFSKQFGPRRRVNLMLLGPAVTMFLLSTLHVAVGLRRLVEGFVQAPQADVYFADLQTWTYYATTALYFTITFVGDSVVIYRCYLIWEANLAVVALPILMLLASTIMGYYTVAGSHFIKPGQSAFAARIATSGRTALCLSLALNVICTGLIVLRIWLSTRHFAPYVGRRVGRYYSALAVIVESAAIYTVSIAVYLGLYIRQVRAFTILSSMNAQIMCIVQVLILVRVGLGLTYTSGWDQSEWSARFVSQQIREQLSDDSV
ncbi:hypothetical protein BOTBODRAFT_30059 [Botryobasidium botryosum FD-172 SS1]|uniref:Uncharacterized protein n=1 Tax=Botryobasidium botryosum (strain FD-172 SS1) TaxID=930990 RepID=A0A067MNA0_BOTB1|nr:hypothetical protein BOTBODRAFT_30059 [Botryobasidium botryosum FD-172 SS1]